MAFDLNFLGGIDEEFDPQSAGSRKLEELTDGDYDFQVREAKVKTLTAKNMLLVETSLEVQSPGRHMGWLVQHTWFVKDKDGAERLGRDLMKLGFDCDEWTKSKGRPFTQEIQKVHKALRGLRFKGKKATNGTFHNLYINKRDTGDGKPARIGPAELDAPDPENESDPFGGPG